ncbi:MAG: hypothetical protein QG567_891 [Campylobacterota bacterium]|nr:hypothetical protein [Campylobacterota bacterium]MDQ1339737.1 hypothetical protein [Campylobacterota bacterium]
MTLQKQKCTNWTIEAAMNKFYKYFLSIFIVLLAGFLVIAAKKTDSSGMIPGMNSPLVFAFSTKETDIRFGYDRFGIEKTDKNSFVYKTR